jgi:hypothetical protein
MEYTITKSREVYEGSHLYDFTPIPQGYIKQCNMLVTSDRKAINRAKRMRVEPGDTFRIVEEK